MDGHRNIGRLKLMCSDVIRKDMKEKGIKDRRSRPESVEIENLMRRPQIGERTKKKIPVSGGWD